MSHEQANESEQQQEPAAEAAETGDAAAQAAEDGRLAELEAELNAAKAKAEENWNLALRAKAEAENTKRRAEIDVANAHKFALEKFIEGLLPVVDSIELGLEAISGEDADVAKFREGSELTLKLMLALLEKNNVEQINPLGEKFDPVCHQAMSMQETSDAEPNTVLKVVQKGYRLNDRVVRPAMVIVAKAVTPPPQQGQIDEMA